MEFDLSIPIVWSDEHRLHEPGGEIWVGVRSPGTELPERAERIRAELTARGCPLVPATSQGGTALAAVHDAELTSYLETAWDGWRQAGLDRDPGQDRVVPYLFPHPGMLPAEAGPLPVPAAATARAGRFAYDTMTLIGPGTWEAARAAIDVAVTAASMAGDGAPAAYACCRPPGHHATRSAFGGSCYLNNAAAAAAALRSTRSAPVAVIDVDAHHGNGTQSIFWDDPGVLTASVHIDPGEGWFPHFLGFEHETGGDHAPGTNRNITLEHGTGDGPWLEAVAGLAGWAAGQGAEGLVVALGVDAALADPESPLRVSAAGYREAGRLLGGLGLPAVIVQEGGYDLDSIGELVGATLAGFESAAT